MSHPSWLPPKNSGEPIGHVTARMETTHSFGTPSISVSMQQSPKKFAPVVAPKPKYNPYKSGQSEGSDGDFLPPPPPPLDNFGSLPSPPGIFPPPPAADETVSGVQVNPHSKTIEERRSSLDAEIDSLTSILADLESSSPYKPRMPQGSSAISPPGNTPVTGHKRMTIPTQPPLTATKKSTTKPQPQSTSQPSPAGIVKPQAQPVPASYATTSTPTRPTFNVQVKSAQPSPHFMPSGPQPGQQYSLQPTQPYQGFQPARSPGPVQYSPSQPRGPEYGYSPPQPVRQPEPDYHYPPAVQNVYQDPYYPMGLGYGVRNDSEPAYGPQPTWRPEPAPAYSLSTGQSPAGAYPPASTKKAYITDPTPLPQAPKGGSSVSGPIPGMRPEDELEQLTKKMLFDMENPPSDEYFGRCSRCGENVVGEGTGCTAMDQVFHVDCFTCMTCNNKLRGQPFYAVDKKAFCEPCYIHSLEQCSVCTKPIMDRILRATGKAYHPHCFSCVVCYRSLDGIPFTVDASGHIHCIEDFHKKFAPRCSVCKEAIMPAPGQEETVRIVALDRDFHVQCYRCEDCGGLLSEGDNQGCYPLDGHILCKTCNSARIQALTAKASTDL
uniref:Lipoma-preferred partner n=1 Tax=Geotrypetes seraphini TaxID=260995 RepID=A0A6P8S7V9_GEOSA|nr:lipoma-preferred partner [Geotrypetes seraphini]XP_033814017.1 lipoma-preferred partner [Geotrypetes seraphini]XP_033814018.1 lipoma-preferred partner [Geotrypetes seraphini]XP_033814019.1 lipoma-preferred partner [Geotrypetes seraphini]XP_033814020.1 lipoma-preferred partner [Geotrypetes seraphini]XP_033814021.1 lipoma-preferred partner [Geotrypetes seraphini]XP_033814022.1 lipoma-preferred partner [Geotrypetes seraphini]